MPIRLGRRTQRWAQAIQRTLPGATGSSNGSPSSAGRMFGSVSSAGPRSPRRRPSGGRSPGEAALTDTGGLAFGSNGTEGALVNVSRLSGEWVSWSMRRQACGFAAAPEKGQWFRPGRFGRPERGPNGSMAYPKGGHRSGSRSPPYLPLRPMGRSALASECGAREATTNKSRLRDRRGPIGRRPVRRRAPHQKAEYRWRSVQLPFGCLGRPSRGHPSSSPKNVARAASCAWPPARSRSSPWTGAGSTSWATIPSR